jgi:hypothetical protein
MKRHVAAAAIFFGVVGSSQIGCASTGVGDPCTPESEFDANGGGAVLSDLGIDLNSTQCDTRVCLQHYFQGRITCPYGNKIGGQAVAGAKCLPVSGMPGLYTLTGAADGDLCCPVVGDVDQKPINKPVEAQCGNRQPTDAVYCTCRCDVPAGVDKSQVKLCTCDKGFQCVPLFTNPALPVGRQGSYCVRTAQANLTPSSSTLDQDLQSACGTDKTP